MEAVPKLPLICFELKVSPVNTHFAPILKQYIAEAYREDPESYSNELHQLEGLRSAAVRPTIDTAGLSALNRYFCQLRAMQSRFPMTKGQPAACSFAWKDLYANMSWSLADIKFEMAGILYNIGALHTQLGSSEPRSSADSMKTACTHYQNAAWVYLQLREQYTQFPGIDADIMRLLQEICSAQAQECILEKSIQDTRKPSVVGAVATQVMLFYKNSMNLLGPSAGADNVHEIIGTKLYNQWYRYLSFKASYIGCIVCLYQGMHAEEQQKMGERVAFYQQAVDKLAEARKLAKYVEPTQLTQEALTFTNDVVEGKKKAAKNENEFIYHEEVPDKDLLMDMKPVCLVKALAINFNDPEVSGPDIFSRLVPMGAHEISSLYSEEKAKLLRRIAADVEAKNTELTEFMSSLQLDQLDILDSEQKIPQEIVDRCAAMNAKADIIQSLVDSMNNLAEIISDVEHSLAEIKTLIQEETIKEKEYQKIMGPRPPSIVQTELSREYHKYQEAHARTNDSNQVLHKAMTLHIANLKLLSQPLDVLVGKIPSVDNIEGLDRETMMEMRRVVGKAREMQTQRDSLVQQLREAVSRDDVTGALLARGPDHADEVFDHELEKHSPQVKIIEQNLAAQENIINKLTSLYASYGDSRRLLTDVLRKREGLINALITSYDTYGELVGKSQKGQEFYRKLLHSVQQLQARLRSTCQVQREERDHHLQRQHGRNDKPSTPTPAPPAASKTPELSAAPPSGAPRKLKDYLPYMKNRNIPRSVTPQAQSEPMQPDGYYPETIYPTGARPAPLGSEANDIPQMQLPDGVMVPPSMQYDRYPSPYAPEPDPYSHGYIHPGANKPFDKQDVAHGYNTPYTPPQYSNQMPEQQQYTNPYYSATHNNGTIVTGSQNPVPNQYGGYDNYIQNTVSQPGPAPATVTLGATNPTELNVHFSQMHVTAPKSEPFAGEYSQTYYSVQYPQVTTPNMATYSHAPQNSNTSMVPSQIPSDYNSLNYPYSNESVNYDMNSVAYSTAAPQYNYATSQNYPVYTNVNSTATSTTSATNTTTPTLYNYPTEHDAYNPGLSQLEAFDKPIKSHVTGEALSTSVSYQNYEAKVQSYTHPNEQTYQPTEYGYTDQTNYSQSYQNHPGYTFNTATGSYDYGYGSQNSYNNVQANVDLHTVGKDANWPNQVYTSAGACDTVQSPSESPAMPPADQPINNQTYYNVPYGYITGTNQSNETVPDSQPVSTNYGANVNQSTYMQSGHERDTSVTFANNQVSTPKENNSDSSFEQETEQISEPTAQITQSNENTVEIENEVCVDKPVEHQPEPSVFDLLSDIDFTVVQKPLVPDIKVPQISESAIKKPTMAARLEPVIPPKEEKIERPAKMELFSNPGLLNTFTQEVRNLQKLVDSLTDKTPSGLTLLDSKWKTFQDFQSKENMKRSKTIAMQHSGGNIVTEVAPYDDTRLTLKSNPNAFINASYYKQLASWCIPLIISKNPTEDEYSVFWKAVLENKVACIVCLLSDIEMQGKFYWPTAKGQSLDVGGGLKVTLDEVACTVHWTERKLTVTSGKTVLNLSHYQINVFPAKIVCSPLLALVEQVLRLTYEGRRGGGLRAAWLQCAGGAGRSALLALLTMLVCQVRAGHLHLCDMLDQGCITLLKHRSNVLEDTKYLADAYRTALFYVQGVLCSGTTMFNGEAVSVQSGAGLLPPVPPTPATSSTNQRSKFSRESFEEMKQSPGLKSGDMKDPLNFLDPLWSLKKK